MNKTAQYEAYKRKLQRRLDAGEISWQEYERLIREYCRRIRY